MTIISVNKLPNLKRFLPSFPLSKKIGEKINDEMFPSLLTAIAN